MCVCVDYERRRAPALKKSGQPAERHECWHIKQAKRWWSLQTVLATAPDEALAEGVLDAPTETHEGEPAF